MIAAGLGQVVEGERGEEILPSEGDYEEIDTYPKKK